MVEKRRLLDAATERPWHVGSEVRHGAAAPIRHHEHGLIAQAGPIGPFADNAALIVAAVNDYAALLDIADAAAEVLLFADPITSDEIAVRDRLRAALFRLHAGLPDPR